MSDGTWIDEYDNVLEFLFWEPQHIGRKSNQSGKNFEQLLAAAHLKEVPLNHLLNYFARLAPEKLLARLMSSLGPATQADRLQLRSPRGLKTHHICQPDMWLSGRNIHVFIEMKVMAPLTVAQIQRYVIFAAEVATADDAIELVLLSPNGVFPAVTAFEQIRETGLMESFANSARALGVASEQIRSVLDRLTIHEKPFSTLIRSVSEESRRLTGDFDSQETLDKLLFGIGFALLRSSEHAATKGRGPNLLPLSRLARHAGRLGRPGSSAGCWQPASHGPDGTIQAGYPFLGRTAEAFIHDVHAGGWVRPIDWSAWLTSDEGRKIIASPSAIADADEEQIAKLLTSLVRQERFAEGSLLDAFAGGFMRAIAERTEQIIAIRNGANC